MQIEEKTNIAQQTACRIRQLRMHNGMSQEDLALSSDISLTYLGQLERCKKNPTVETLSKICIALNISLSEFFLFDDIELNEKYRLAYKTIESSLKSLPSDSAIRLSHIVRDLASLNQKNNT